MSELHGRVTGWQGAIRFLGERIWTGDARGTKQRALRDAWGYAYREFGHDRAHQLVNRDDLVPYCRPIVDGDENAGGLTDAGTADDS